MHRLLRTRFVCLKRLLLIRCLNSIGRGFEPGNRVKVSDQCGSGAFPTSRFANPSPPPPSFQKLPYWDSSSDRCRALGMGLVVVSYAWACLGYKSWGRDSMRDRIMDCVSTFSRLTKNLLRLLTFYYIFYPFSRM